MTAQIPDRPHVAIRFSAAEIATRVDEMAADLAVKLPADTLVVSVLKGSFVFAADLIRALSRAGANWSMDFVTLSSYGTGTKTSGNVRIVRDIVDDVRASLDSQSGGRCAVGIDGKQRVRLFRQPFDDR